MTIEEFKIKFKEIKEKGFIRSTRCGPTGIGHTLETYLGLKENNNTTPDIEGAELKAHRSGGNNLITLFTFNRKAWKISPLEAVKKYGSLDKNGDSKTTVAYGQFSFFGNHWLGVKDARKLDNLLMGGSSSKSLYLQGTIKEYILEIEKQSNKRACEASSYYFDLESSIKAVANAISDSGYSIYIVGNRCVKGITLPTDQFIAEQFELMGLKHVITYERLIGNKSMPLKNSPSNITGKRMGTMTKEYIVVCRKC